MFIKEIPTPNGANRVLLLAEEDYSVDGGGTTSVSQEASWDALACIPPRRNIIGTVLVLQTIINGQNVMYTSEETMSKPHFGKEPGDRSPIAGGREPEERIPAALWREAQQESGLPPRYITVDRHPVGFFSFHPDVWIVAFKGWVDPRVLEVQTVAPADGETTDPLWVPPAVYRDFLPARAGMIGIVDAVIQGRLGIVAPVSPARHVGQLSGTNRLMRVSNGSIM